MQKYFYAEYDTGEGIDLWRFTTKTERDQFVADRPSTASVITVKLANLHHKDQMDYWKRLAK